MKRTFIIILTLAFCKILLGQTDSSTFKSSLNDSVLNKIYSYLPKGWIVTEKNNKIIFQRIDSAYVMENSYDSIFYTSTKAERRARIMKEGKKTVSRITFRCEEKWNYTKLLTTKNNNLYYNKKLQGLPEKYKITSLLDKDLSTKSDPVFVGTTEKEKEAIKKYEKERSEILANITNLPSYNTEKFSLFLVSREGYTDSSNYVVPEEASLQLFKILALFFDFASL
jgi:hypothetical protein